VGDNGGQALQFFVRAIACTPEALSDPAPSPPLTLAQANPVAEFDAPASAATGARVDFTDRSVRATSWLWVVDEPPFQAFLTPSLSYTFRTAGTHTVFQIASNGNGSDVRSRVLTITAAGAPREAAVETLALDTRDPERQRLRALHVRRGTLLLVRAHDAVLWLRLVDGERLAAERRVVVPAGVDLRMDLSAYVPEGDYELELVGWQTFEASVEKPAPRQRDDADPPRHDERP
jgi:hypothetical protein